MSSAFQYVRGLSLCFGYIVLSGGLIEFNKFLMAPGRFPHAMALTCVHMLMTFVLCNAFYFVRPDFYPAMQDTKGKRLHLLKWFVPLALLFAVSLFCSNQAYMYCSPAFLQFMKEGNIVLVFILSVAVGLQIISRARLVNIVWILAGATLAVSGQVQFAITGFAFQLISQFGESGKNVMGDWMMKSHLKLDPLTYTMFLAPTCLVVLVIGAAVSWSNDIASDFALWWHLVIPNACLAFTLNVCISCLIKECSAFTFILAGLFKDAAIVLLGALVMGETVVPQQYIGFIVCLSGVFFWSYARMNPGAHVVRLFDRATCSEMEESAEGKPLLPKAVK